MTQLDAPEFGTAAEPSSARARNLVADPVALIEDLPQAVFAVDFNGTVCFANERLLAMTGRSRDDLIGHSAATLLDPADVDAAGLLLSNKWASSQLLGPRCARYLDADGVARYTNFWATRLDAAAGFDGFLVTFSPESMRDVLANAVASFAQGGTLPSTLSLIASAARARPFDGVGTILLVEPNGSTDRDRFRVCGDWPLDDELVNAFGTPWRRALVQAESADIVDASLGGIDARVGAALGMAGLPCAWIRPILGPEGAPAAVFIIWRREVAIPTPNQEQSMHEAMGFARLTIEQARAQRDMQLSAHRDALTGVGSRAALSDRIALEQGSESALFVDLDHFRRVNDIFGHAIGDEVIAQVGRRISGALRGTDDVYRFGGDQFVVVCPGPLHEPTGLLRLADRLVERLAGPYDCAAHRVRLSATIGVANAQPCQGVDRSLPEVIDRACGAMYAAKERGRGSVVHADLPG